MSTLTLENLKVTTPKEHFFANLATKDENELNGEQSSKNDSNILCHFDHFMSQKKMHEVLMLSETVSEICQREGVKSLADVGSGKAYLRYLEQTRLGSINCGCEDCKEKILKKS